MVSPGSGSRSGVITGGWDSHADDGAGSRSARDRQSPADLGRAALHRLQTEVTRMSRSGRTRSRCPGPPGAPARPGPHLHQGGGGLRVLDDVGERLAPDPVEVSLHFGGQPKARLRPATLMSGVPAPPSSTACRASADTSPSWTGSRQLEDESAHLALNALGSPAIAPRDCPTRPELPFASWASVFWAVRVWSTVENRACETESCRSRAIRRRSSTARSPSLVRASASSRGRSLALRDHGAQEQRRESGDSDVELVLSVWWSIACCENAPTLWAVTPIVTAAVIAMDSVEPGPKSERHPDQRGEHHVVTGSSVDTAITPSAITAAIAAPPSQVRIRRQARIGSWAQASISGSTTNPPDVSPSHHVRQNSPRQIRRSPRPRASRGSRRSR